MPAALIPESNITLREKIVDGGVPMELVTLKVALTGDWFYSKVASKRIRGVIATEYGVGTATAGNQTMNVSLSFDDTKRITFRSPRVATANRITLLVIGGD